MRLLFFLIPAFIFLSSCSSTDTKSSHEHTLHTPTALQLYDGPELPENETSKVLSEQSGSYYMYFIGHNDRKLPNRSLMNGPHEVHLKPGKHSLQMRFVSKGQLAIPLKSFPTVNFEAGKTYLVKAHFQMGKGDYISSAKNTKIKAWIEEVETKKQLTEITVNGFGK